jgi:hypothetical protein
MQMKLAQSENPLWKSMGKSLAEASGCFQEKDSSPLFGIDPQLSEHWKSSAHNLRILGIIIANPQGCVGSRRVKLLARRGRDNKPRLQTPY